MAHEHEEHQHAHEGFEVEVERKGPCLATIRFTVSAPEIARTRARGLRNLAGRTRMKGFRPGKTPRQVIEKQFGAQVDRDLVEHFLNHAYQDAVQEHGLEPAAHPRIDVDTIPLPAEGDFHHEFDVYLKPEFEIGDYKGLAIQSQSTEVTDEDVEETLKDLRQRNSHPERTEDAGLEASGMAVCRLTFHVAGDEEPALDREGLRLSPRTPPPGVDAEEFESTLVGLREGETRTVPIASYPDDFPQDAARGRKGTLEVTASEVYRIVEPPAEEIWRAFEVEDDDALRAALRARIQEAKVNNEQARIESELLERLIAQTPIELPDPLIEERADARVADLRRALGEESGLDEAELEQRLAEERAQAREQQAKALRAMYLIEEIAKREELLVSRDDLAEELKAIALRNETSLDEVRKYYQEQGLLQQLGIELLERKVRSFLRESADIQPAG